MDRESVFDAWAPRGGAWTPWAKPVLFAYVDDVRPHPWWSPKPDWAHPDALNLVTRAPSYRTSATRARPAIVVDLPGVESVAAGVALCELGFRPVPLFTALPSASSVVPMEEVLLALVAGAEEVLRAKLPLDAAPAFLLDARRLGPNEEPRVGQFDNRSVVFPGDFPSAERLRSRGIDSVILIQASDPWQYDLRESLAEWQRCGLAISRLRTDAPVALTDIDVRPPSFFARIRVWWERHMLHRDTQGAFGAWKRERPHGG